jgi:hypothetical protein
MRMRHTLIAAAGMLCWLTAAHATDRGASFGGNCAATTSFRPAPAVLHPVNYTAVPQRVCRRDAANFCRSAAAISLGMTGQLNASVHELSRLALNECSLRGE